MAVVTRPAHAEPRSARRPPTSSGGLSGWIRRFELSCVAVFHLTVGCTIWFAPRSQVVTPGTSAIFGTVPPAVWVLWFLTTGTVAAAAVYRSTPLRLSLTWIGVFPLGAAWIYGFSVAVLGGRGNAVFALVWPFLLIWWATLAVRCYFGGTGARWGGG